MATVLITGGSGLIGTALTKALMAAGWTVHHLGRTRRERPGVRSFVWDLHSGTMDKASLIGVDHIVHLAGAGIAEKRWTDTRLKELIESRTVSARLLLSVVKEEQIPIKSFVSAAGIGYYGANTSSHVYTENDSAGTDTIAMISRVWEEAVDEWRTVTRVVKLRTPIVLSRNGGALGKLVLPSKFGLGAALGSGDQWMPWVHMSDLVRAYMHALSNQQMQGAYNVNSGHPVTNVEFMRTLASVLHRPWWLPPVPGFVLKLALGELASILLEGSRASNAKLLGTGFEFQHGELREAFQDLLN